MTSPQRVREMIPATERFAYLNNAATSPTSDPVRGAMAAFEDDRAARGERGWEDWIDAVTGARQTTAHFFEAKPEEVALLKNTSDGINQVASSIPWKRGDEVVTTDQEFPSNIMPWKLLERRGVKVKIVKSRNEVVHEEDVERAITKNTRLVTVSSVFFGTGQRLDVRRIAKRAHERGAQILVDVIQGAGAVDTSFSRWDVDYLACGGHKWLMAPLGVGTLIVRQELIEGMTPGSVGWFGREDLEEYSVTNTKLASTARRFENGNLNLGGVHGWRAALGLLLSVPRREELVVGLSGRLMDHLREGGLKPVTPKAAGRRAGIVCVPVKNLEESQMHLRKKTVLVAIRGKYIRLSPHFWNTNAEVDRTAKELVHIGRA